MFYEKESETMKKENRISKLGFGTLRLPVNEYEGRKIPNEKEIREMIQEAYRSGITYFDCAPTYCAGRCEQVVGSVLKPFRKNILIASKVPLDVLKNPGDLRRMLEQSLERLDTDYLDYYYFWGIKKKDFEKTALEEGFLEEMNILKQSGVIKYIGFSFHDQPSYVPDILHMALERGIPFDAVLCQYNIIDDMMKPFFSIAKEKYGVKNFVMGAAAGGKLDFRRAYYYVWNHPSVDCVLSGMQSVKMVRENVNLFQEYTDFHCQKEQVWKKAVFDEKKRKEHLLKLYCTGCGYCMPCQKGIDIPQYLKALQQMYFFQDEKEYFKYISRYGHPKTQCILCGQCEKRCPQGILIRKYIMNKNEEKI